MQANISLLQNMSFLNGLRGMWKNKPDLNSLWSVPDQYSDIEYLFKPNAGVAVIYKHSFSCGVSIFAKTRLEESLDTLAKHAELVFVDVKQNRTISNKIAKKTGVRHESPQVLVMHKGEVYWHGSHNRVQAGVVNEAIHEITGKTMAT